MGKFTVLSVGLHAEVRALGLASGAFSLGRHPIFFTGGLAPEDGGRAAADELAERLPQRVDEEPRNVVFLVPDPLPKERRTALAQALTRAGLATEAFVSRIAIARDVAREMKDVEPEHVWLLEVGREGFHLVQLEGEGRIDADVSFEFLDEERRHAVAHVFREEHRVDIKHVGGSPERVDRWLEHLHREGKLQTERSVEWEVPDGSALDVRTGPLRSALEGIHAGAILSIENACLRACTEVPGAIIISESVEAWFQIATTLRASLLGTQVLALRSEQEIERIETWLVSQGAAGAGKAWVVDASFVEVERVRCGGKKKKPQVEPEPAAEPEPRSRGPEPKSETVAAAPAPPAASVSQHAAPPPRPTPEHRAPRAAPVVREKGPGTSTFVVVALVLLLLGQAALAAWMVGRSDVNAAETRTAVLPPSQSRLEELSDKLGRMRTSHEEERKSRRDLTTHIGRLEASIAELQTALGETLTSQQLKPIWDEIDALRPAPDDGPDPEALGNLESADRRMKSDLTAMIARVDSLEGNIETLRREFRPDASALDALWEKSRENEEVVEGVREATATCSAEIETLQTSILALHDAVDGIGALTAGPESLPADVAARLDAIERTAASAARGDAELGGRLEEVAGSVAIARENLNRLESRMPLEDSSPSVADLTSRVAATESSLTALTATADRAEKRFDALRESVDDLTSAAQDPSGPDPQLVARLDRVEQDVGTLRTDRNEAVDLDEVWKAVRTNGADVASIRELVRNTPGHASSGEIDDSKLHADLSTYRFRAYNSDVGRVFRAGSDAEGHGSTKLYNKNGSRVVLLGSASGGRTGFLGTYHENGAQLFQVTSNGASGAGHMSLANARGEPRITMTTSPEDDGLLRISDRDGRVVEFNGGGGDLAEAVRPAAGFEIVPGQVVRLVDVDADGPLVAPAEDPYDPEVLGIVSGAGTLSPALSLNVTGRDAERMVALAGQVYCLVDATKSPVRKGDLLTSSSRPGHAQVADPERATPGTILGKALGDLESGTGLIRVWVNNR